LSDEPETLEQAARAYLAERARDQNVIRVWRDPARYLIPGTDLTSFWIAQIGPAGGSQWAAAPDPFSAIRGLVAGLAADGYGFDSSWEPGETGPAGG